MFQHNFNLDKDFTYAIYETIKNQHYYEAIWILKKHYSKHPQSWASLSLLAYCYFNTQDFIDASSCYEQLAKLHPQEASYKLYQAYSLYQLCNYEKAMRVISMIDDPNYLKKVTKLKAAVKYSEDDLGSSQSLLDSIKEIDSDLLINGACIEYKEGRYEEALEKFSTALLAEGYNPHLSYSIALCYYKLKDYGPALKYIGDIIERGIKEHPELSVGMATEGIQVRSVGNTYMLHQTALIEAFNLKAAIEYQLNNVDSAKEALTDMPPRLEEELDAVTLHNLALANMQERPTEGFEKLQFLLQQNTFPSETLGNLLILYCKYGYYSLAADMLSENAHISNDHLSQCLHGFMSALITKETSTEGIYRHLDDLAQRHTEQLQRAAKLVQEARLNQDDHLVKHAVAEYDQALQAYLPVLMAQAKLYWDQHDYNQVESIFHKSVEFCNENDTWRLHVANVLFMQDNKYKEATAFYEVIVKKHQNNLLSVPPLVLANLCVSYIMSSMNEEAEELMRKIEKEEDRYLYHYPEKKVFHLSTVNLVIGTLYCSKGNFDFGVNRLIWSLEPFQRKLGPHTWFYTKRCLLSLLENFAKRTINPSESLQQECIRFLDKCSHYGKDIKAAIQSPFEDSQSVIGNNTIAYEARLLKAILQSFSE